MTNGTQSEFLVTWIPQLQWGDPYKGLYHARRHFEVNEVKETHNMVNQKLETY